MILGRNQISLIIVVAVWNINFFIYFLKKQVVVTTLVQFFLVQVTSNQTTKKQKPNIGQDFKTMYCTYYN